MVSTLVSSPHPPSRSDPNLPLPGSRVVKVRPRSSHEHGCESNPVDPFPADGCGPHNRPFRTGMGKRSTTVAKANETRPTAWEPPNNWTRRATRQPTKGSTWVGEKETGLGSEQRGKGRGGDRTAANRRQVPEPWEKNPSPGPFPRKKNWTAVRMNRWVRSKERSTSCERSWWRSKASRYDRKTRCPQQATHSSPRHADLGIVIHVSRKAAPREGQAVLQKGRRESSSKLQRGKQRVMIICIYIVLWLDT